LVVLPIFISTEFLNLLEILLLHAPAIYRILASPADECLTDKKHAMLKKFRIEEDEAPQNSSMSEIQSKQGASRGLTIVNDDVFNFFI
jgi:hypothetical protein